MGRAVLRALAISTDYANPAYFPGKYPSLLSGLPPMPEDSSFSQVLTDPFIR